MKNFYTIQTAGAWIEVQNKGYLVGNREYVYDDWIRAYNWMMNQMANKIEEYNREYPIWLWTNRPDLRHSALLESGTKGVLLEIIIHEDRVLLSDFNAWNSVLMDVPVLAYEGESIDKDKSWERIFDIDYLRKEPEWGSVYPQGVTGKILVDEIKLIREFIAR